MLVVWQSKKPKGQDTSHEEIPLSVIRLCGMGVPSNGPRI